MNLEQRRKLSKSHKGQISWIKGKHHTKESKRKISEANKGNNFWLGRSHSEESKKLMSESHKGKHLSPKTEFKKGLIPWNKGKSPSKESIEKSKKAIKEKYLSDPEYRKMRSETQKKLWSNPEYRKRMSESQEKLWRNPEHQKRMSQSAKVSINAGRFRKGHEFPEETKQKIRDYTLKQYESGSFPRQTNTKPESQIKEELIKRGYKESTDFIHQYKFMNKFMCDFCFPKQKVIIEVDGDFWHANPNKYPDQSKLHPHQIKGIGKDKSKSAYITKVDNGSWKLLRIWESDIKKDIIECVNKIEKALNDKKGLN